MPPHKVKQITLILLFHISHFFNLHVGDYWLPENAIYNRQIMVLRPFRKGVSLHERRQLRWQVLEDAGADVKQI